MSPLGASACDFDLLLMLRSVKERPRQLTRGTTGSYDGPRVLRSEHEFAPKTALR